MSNVPTTSLRQGCNYGGSVNDASELCEFYKGNNFATYKNADIALDKILDVTGMSKRFVLKECNDISNCVATAYKGIRYILYDRDFMDAIASRTNSWSSMSILAHEIGHHVNGHSLDLIVYASEAAEAPTLRESRQMEIEADEYSGFVMFKLGASLAQAQEAIRLISTNDDDSYSTHPSKNKRLNAIERGYNNAKSQVSNKSEVQSSNNDYSTNSSTLTAADDYFYRARDNAFNYEYKIENYTKCLQIDPDYVDAYRLRGLTYFEEGNYRNAIDDFTSFLIRVPDDFHTIRIRGIAKEKLGIKSYCSDYYRACQLGNEISCEWFYKKCN